MTAIGIQKFEGKTIICSDTQATTGDKVANVQKIFFNKDTLIAVSGTLLEKQNYIDLIDEISKEGMSQDIWCSHLKRWNDYFIDEDFELDMGCFIIHKGVLYKTTALGTVWTPWDIDKQPEGMGSGDHFVEASMNVVAGVCNACCNLLSCGGDVHIVILEKNRFRMHKIDRKYVEDHIESDIESILYDYCKN